MKIVALALCLWCIGSPASAQGVKPNRESFGAFETATVKLSDPAATGGAMMMDGTHRFLANRHTLKMLIGAAWSLNPRQISGGPSWIDEARFDVAAITPGSVEPTREEQMRMLRALLAERFGLRFRREARVMTIYELRQASGGARLRAAARPEEGPRLLTRISPVQATMPARSASLDDFAETLQRKILDRPVVDRTGLQGKFDFDLTWAPDENAFHGDYWKAPEDGAAVPIFVAIKQQLGLELLPAKGLASAFVVEAASKPQAD